MHTDCWQGWYWAWRIGHIYIYKHMNTQVNTCMGLSIHTDTCIQICMHVCVHINVYINLHTHMYTFTYIHVHICTYPHTCIKCIHKYTCTFVYRLLTTTMTSMMWGYHSMVMLMASARPASLPGNRCIVYICMSVYMCIYIYYIYVYIYIYIYM